MKTAAIYARVSTTEQAEKGYSLKTQLESCRAAAIAGGAVKIDEYIDDGYSGEFINRPGLDRLRMKLKAIKYEFVIVYDPDRLARNLAHQLIITEEIEKSGSTLKFISVSFEQSPEGKLFYSIRGAISDYEKEKIKERTMRGLRGKAQSGKLTRNDKPLGYDFNKDNQMYIINEYEAVIIRKIFELCTKHLYGTRLIARELNLMGYRTKSGNRFYMAAILRILTNPMYKGSKMAFRYYDKQIGQRKTIRTLRDPEEWIKITVPAIVSPKTWEKAQQVLKDNQIHSKRNAKRDYLLSGLVKCGFCGKAMNGINYSSHGYEYRYYICCSRTAGNECKNRYIPLEKLDSDVWEDIYKSVLEQNELLENFKPDNSEDNSLRERMTAELNGLIERQKAIAKWVRNGILDITIAEKELEEIKQAIDFAALALNNLSTIKQQKVKDTSQKKLCRAETYEQKRQLLREWGVKVYVKRDNNNRVEWSFKL